MKGIRRTSPIEFKRRKCRKMRRIAQQMNQEEDSEDADSKQARNFVLCIFSGSVKVQWAWEPACSGLRSKREVRRKEPRVQTRLTLTRLLVIKDCTIRKVLFNTLWRWKVWEQELRADRHELLVVEKKFLTYHRGLMETLILKLAADRKASSS